MLKITLKLLFVIAFWSNFLSVSAQNRCVGWLIDNQYSCEQLPYGDFYLTNGVLNYWTVLVDGIKSSSLILKSDSIDISKDVNEDGTCFVLRPKFSIPTSNCTIQILCGDSLIRTISTMVLDPPLKIIHIGLHENMNKTEW